MSQAKVDAYKKEKANRKKNLKSQKTKSLIYKILGGVAALAVVVWIVWSVVDTTKPVTYTEAEKQSMLTNILKYADYLGLDKSEFGIEETTTKAEQSTTKTDEKETTKADDETTTAKEDETTKAEEETTTTE